MSFRFLLIFNALYISSFQMALGQRIVSFYFPERIEQYEHWPQLMERKNAYTSEIEAEIARVEHSNLSENTKFHLKIVLESLIEAREDNFVIGLQRIMKKRPEAAIDIGRFEVLEEKLIHLNRRLDALASLYEFKDKGLKADVIDSSVEIQQELAFYEIKDGDSIGEIGAGTVTFGACLAQFYDRLTVYINEVDYSKLESIAFHLQFNPLFKQKGHHFYSVLGSNTSTGLEYMRLDKVIMRSALHHFESPAEMLSSIRLSLAPNGLLLIKEKYRDQCHQDCCEQLLPEAALKTMLDKAGFTLVESERPAIPGEDEWRLLKYSVNQNK